MSDSAYFKGPTYHFEVANEDKKLDCSLSFYKGGIYRFLCQNEDSLVFNDVVQELDSDVFIMTNVDDVETRITAEGSVFRVTYDPFTIIADGYVINGNDLLDGGDSTALNILFDNEQGFYGFPEHADSYKLRKTVNDDPYRLFNLDVFEYDVRSVFPLYGAIPFVMSRENGKIRGFFYNNPSEMFLDVSDKDIYFYSEAGVVDLFGYIGPSYKKVQEQHHTVVGTPKMPRMNVLGYHQCRWNYKDDADSRFVVGQFEKYGLPFDFLWLDIEHTNDKRYFTWDLNKFPDPQKLVSDINDLGREVVIIADPHIKDDKGYHVFKAFDEANAWIRDNQDQPFKGHCWPGASRWPDFVERSVRDIWADLVIEYSKEYGIKSIWNDMNENSVFNGPEVSHPRDAKHINGRQHKELHNVMGFYHTMATIDGLKRLNPDERPFVLTRSFYGGTSAQGVAVWTGDNTADWDHLAFSIPMLLSLQTASQYMSGADVGGFFGNPDGELFARWMELGSWQPFFRGHAHLDTKRREPWSFGDEVLELVKKQVLQRYKFMPFWYTVFYESERHHFPPMNPMFVLDNFSDDVEDQYLVGDKVLVAPILHSGSSQRDVTLPAGRWYDLQNSRLAFDLKKTKKVVAHAPLGTIPVFQRGGTIIPFTTEKRRSVTKMIENNYSLSLLVAPNALGNAEGSVFVDDGSSYAYETLDDGAAYFTILLDGDAIEIQQEGVILEEKVLSHILIMDYPCIKEFEIDGVISSNIVCDTTKKSVLINVDTPITTMTIKLRK
ncbi:hypothetical protein PCE1_000210 [Barthelona sp. PCE]